jgi:polyketide biosynthesis enoyl-CoA hydratase PksI
MTVVDIRPVDAGVAVVRIDDAANGNRLSEAVCQQLMEALAALARDDSVHVLVLAGSPEVFCAGAPLEVLRRIASGDIAVRDLALPAQVIGFPVPVVAALEGHAVGGGLVLALCADMQIAAEDRRYGVNFTDLGFTPGMGTTALLPALVPHNFACEMMCAAKLFKGRELAGRGLFNHVVPAPDVWPCAIDLARRIAEKPRTVLAELKRALAAPRLAALDAALAREHEMHTVSFSQPDIAQRIESAYHESERTRREA